VAGSGCRSDKNLHSVHPSIVAEGAAAGSGGCFDCGRGWRDSVTSPLQCLRKTVTAATPRVLLIAENLCLRQQPLALQRRHPQPRLRNADRRFWIIASRWFGGWHDSLLIVKPEAMLRWHRRGWRAYWSWRSRRQWGRGGRRSIRPELQALIRRITTENRLWGQKRIQAELSRLGLLFLRGQSQSI
jgi:hypothetical protein